MTSLDPLALAQDLIRARSVTPADDGAQAILAKALTGLGFAVRDVPFGEVSNLYAVRDRGGPRLCFAGHTDVVPPGDVAAWRLAPFAAHVEGGKLWGRGAADMKGALAAMVAAVAGYDGPGTLAFLITGDEEGPAIDGTRRVVETLQAQGERFDFCIVGEPTSEQRLGDVIKNGRRGSLNCVLTSHGAQGHVAYPQKARNPLPALLDALAALRSRVLDTGAPGFQPSNLEITTIDVANSAHNVIPARATAKLNIRFNTAHHGAGLSAWIEEIAAKHAITADIRVTGEPFYSPPGPLTDAFAAAVAQATGAAPLLSTSGGTSDARFLKDMCPVVELGLRNDTAHQVDEHVDIADIHALAGIYRGAIARLLGGA